MSKAKVIAVVGPTASGKTALGIYLAQKLNGEIISADSRQVYKGLDIGTGKVTKKEMAGIPHHLLNVASPKKSFSVSDFKLRGEKALKKIFKNGRVPIIVGGTGLYADVLLGRIVVPEVPPNPKLRKLLEKKSAEQLFAQLRMRDPERAKTIEPHHKRRLIRALEIATAIGCSPSTSDVSGQSPYDVLWLGLAPSPAQLAKNIKKRLEVRLKAGMLAEGRRLHRGGLSYKRMEELGLEYRAMARYLQGTTTQSEMEEEIVRSSIKYAKRQGRWFVRNKDIAWLKSKSQALRLAKSFLKL